MASNQPAAKGGPLSMMTKVSDIVYTYEPSDRSARPPSSPELVVLFAWMGGRPAHVAKYVVQHQALFPTSSILLVMSQLPEAFFASTTRKTLPPAVSFAKAVLGVHDTPGSHEAESEEGQEDDGRQAPPRVLFHVMSNGGCLAVRLFCDLWLDGGAPLPRHVTVMDSCPGLHHWMRSYRAVSQGLPAWLAPVMHLVLAAFWVCTIPFGRKVILDESADSVRDKRLLPSEARRVYIYSEEDAVISPEDVRDHAAAASADGFNVQLERFNGSQHVCHARHDPERYWGTLKRTWDGGGS